MLGDVGLGSTRQDGIPKNLAADLQNPSRRLVRILVFQPTQTIEYIDCSHLGDSQ
jgi:hypothetical protein